MAPVEPDQETDSLLAGAGSPINSAVPSRASSSSGRRWSSLSALLLFLLPVAWLLGHMHGRGWLTLEHHVDPHAKVTPFAERAAVDSSTLEARMTALQSALAAQRDQHAAALAQERREHSRSMEEASRNATKQLDALKTQLAKSPSALIPAPHPRVAELSLCASDTSRHAFIFYGYVITLELMQFIVELSVHTNFGIYVVADRADYVWPAEAEHPRVHLIRLSQAYTIFHNFTHFSAGHGLGVPPQQACMAMDKAMLLARALTQFGESKPPNNEAPFLADVLPTLCRTYCRAWLIEDDALIPSVQSAVHVNARTAVADFVSPPSRTVAQDGWWMWWTTLSDYPHMDLPPRHDWRHNMCNAIALSTHLCRLVQQHAQRYGRLLYSESWLPTLSLQRGLVHVESRDLVLKWRAVNSSTTDYTPEHQRSLSPSAMAWFHPMKTPRLRWEARVAAITQRGQCPKQN